LSADGVNLKDMDLTEAVTYIKGPESTAVLLTVKRGEDVFPVGVLRKRFALPTVEYSTISQVGYVKVWSFGAQTDVEFDGAVSQMEEKGMGLVIDLRGNGGGYLHTAVNMAASFVGNRPAVIAWNKNDGFIPLAGIPSRMIVMPAIILTDGYTASASEIFSAALRDYGIAAIIGETTFGKGSIQSLFELSNGDVLKLTTHYFYTPAGKPINGVGLEPDLNLRDEHLLNAAVLLLAGDAEEKESKKGFVAVKVGDRITG